MAGSRELSDRLRAVLFRGLFLALSTIFFFFFLKSVMSALCPHWALSFQQHIKAFVIMAQKRGVWDLVNMSSCFSFLLCPWSIWYERG